MLFAKDEGNQGFGVLLSTRLAVNNVIGGDSTVQVISGNSTANVGIALGASDNKIYGNYIGTDISGNNTLLVAAGNQDGDGVVLPNQQVRYVAPGTGVQMIGGSRNTIGGDGLGQRNVIAGNHNDGVYVASLFLADNVSFVATGNRIQGNTTSEPTDWAWPGSAMVRGVVVEGAVGTWIGGLPNVPALRSAM